MQSKPDAQSTRLILWVAMVTSIALYFAVAQLASPAEAHPIPTLTTTLFITAIAAVAASFLLKPRLQPQTGFILALVLCESAAILGLVLHFTTAAPEYYLFILLGLAGMILHFPRSSSQPD